MTRGCRGCGRTAATSSTSKVGPCSSAASMPTPSSSTPTPSLWLPCYWKKDFCQAWRARATRLKDSSGIPGSAIFNEAHPLPIPPRIFDKYYLWPMFKDAIEAIGAVDPNHLFIVEGILLLTMNTAVVHLKAPNLVYGTHLYEGSLIPPFWTGDPAFLHQRVQQRIKEAAEVPAPLWIGELR